MWNKEGFVAMTLGYVFHTSKRLSFPYANSCSNGYKAKSFIMSFLSEISFLCVLRIRNNIWGCWSSLSFSIFVDGWLSLFRSLYVYTLLWHKCVFIFPSKAKYYLINDNIKSQTIVTNMERREMDETLNCE